MLEILTSNRLLGVLVGAGVTAIIQSLSLIHIFYREREMDEKNLPAIDLRAVSYTHLDVYKRQGGDTGFRLIIVMTAAR